jgi:hypothetical protein
MDSQHYLHWLHLEPTHLQCMLVRIPVCVPVEGLCRGVSHEEATESGGLFNFLNACGR